jgi:methylenetetrahydrofolate reductase (NADPH)
MCELCGSTVPPKILEDLKRFKDDDKQVQDYGVQQMIDMCRTLVANGIYGLHFYTLNQETSVTRILLGLGLIKEEDKVKPLPWTGARSGGKEDVRPIFWANRPKTYMHRTRDWDDFPNGRWGDPGSPAFSTLDIYHLNLYRVSPEKRLSEWGSPRNTSDVANVFVSYLNGRVSALPWNHTQLAPEASAIFSQLKNLNSHGFLTINSQPRVNAAPSDHPSNGWGPVGGYVWQKAYVEFFCSLEHLEQLKALLPKYSSLQLQAISKMGDRFSTFNTVTAVTWGIFPGSEVKQPTVVDPEVFGIWKDEAFALWASEWSDLYPKDSEPHKVIEEIANTFYLVNIVDNDFTQDNIFGVFQEIIESEALILADIEQSRQEKVKALEGKLQELEAETKKLAEERKAFEAEKAAWASQNK